MTCVLRNKKDYRNDHLIKYVQFSSAAYGYQKIATRSHLENLNCVQGNSGLHSVLFQL